MQLRRYRVNRDNYNSNYWCVECWRLWFPFWIEVGAGLLRTKEDAIELCDILRETN